MSEVLPELLETVDRLTLPFTDPVWQDVLNDRGIVKSRDLVSVRRPALLAQLRSAISSSLGQTHGGHSDAASRIQLNVTAFTMFEDMDGRIRLMARTVGVSPVGDAESLLRQWFVHVRNLVLSNQTTDDALRISHSLLRGWVKQIESMFDPEVVIPLPGACPECKAVRVRRGHGEEEAETAALYIHYKESDPEAVCRVCGWATSGPRGLLELGYHLGATVDVEALKEMGVIV